MGASHRRLLPRKRSSMPQQTEPSANNALGLLLQKMMPRATVRSEHTQTIIDQPGLHPDIVITASGRSPVVVEAEYMPAYTAEADAKGRLGLEVVNTARLIESAIALRYPEEVHRAENLAEAITGATLSYCVLSEDEGRFPESGWLEGSVTDLAELVRLVSVPQRAVDAAADALQAGIERVAAILGSLENSKPDILPAIAALLGMADVEQTRRMAGAIVANAMVYHERLAGMHGVKPLSQLCSEQAPSPKGNILEAWTQILKVNYWPIFSIARDIVEQLPAAEASQVLRTLRWTVEDVAATGANQAHDLTGRIFQRLIADRKFLATFYTLPASAALLARLAISKMEGVDWSDPEAIGKLRIGDFACGTGALLSAVYDQIAVRHEQAGGDVSALHPVMMEEVLYGCDVMPSAIHITGSTLSGMEPQVKYGKSRLYTLAYGRQEDGTVRIGSLELLQSSSTMTLFNTADPALRTGSVGEETASQVIVDIPDEGFDLVIMNPPFTRNTTNEGVHSGEFNAAFAAFSTSEQDQRDMGQRLGALKSGTCYHGNAGVASAFAALADRKIRPGGVLALVLPLSAAGGFSWRRFRQMMADRYSDWAVVSLAAADNREISFSADTGMGECLVIARKRPKIQPPSDRCRFISLVKRPAWFGEAASMGNRIVAASRIRQLEDGPYGGTSLAADDQPVGQTISLPKSLLGASWPVVRMSDYALAQVAYGLTQSELWPPGRPTAVDCPTTTLGQLAQTGLHHRDITGPSPRGPFSKVAASATATYPALWNHNAKRETKLVCEPDASLEVRPSLEVKANALWAMASRAHLSLDFRFNSQPLCAAITDTPTMGGRAWPNVKFESDVFDEVFTLWSNSTVGLVMFWWHANRQVAGRGTTAKTPAEGLTVLDFRTLRVDQLDTAKDTFDDFRERDLMPAYLADADPNRALLDQRVICDLLGFNEEIYEGVRRLAAKWCAEPSVHGGKKRPAGATLAI